MKGKSRASVTLEATIGLIVFIAVSVTMAMMIRVVYIESLMQHALNQTATEIASYSYFLDVTGVREGYTEFMRVTNPGREYVNSNLGDVFQMVDDFNQTVSSVSGVSKDIHNGDVSAALNSTTNVAESFNNMVSSGGAVAADITEIAKNPVQCAKYFVQAMGNQGGKYLGGKAVEVVARLFMDKHLALDGKTADQYLTKKLVIDGVSGLDFSGSTIFSDGRSIDLVISYQVRVPAPIPFVKEFSVRQRAMANSWCNQYDGQSIWVALAPVVRGQEIINSERNIKTNSVYKRYDADTKTGTVAITVDLSAETYQSEDKIRYLLNSKMQKITSFHSQSSHINDYGGNTVNATDIEKTTYVIYYPENSTAEEKQRLSNAIAAVKEGWQEDIEKYNITFAERPYDREI